MSDPSLQAHVLEYDVVHTETDIRRLQYDGQHRIAVLLRLPRQVHEVQRDSARIGARRHNAKEHVRRHHAISEERSRSNREVRTPSSNMATQPI